MNDYQPTEVQNEEGGKEKLEALEKQSRNWIEHSPACTKIVDLDYNLQYMSDAGIKALKIDDITKYYGKPYPLKFYPGKYRDIMDDIMKKTRTTGEIVEQEVAVTDSEGGEKWFHSTVVPVNDDEGNIEYMLIVSINITERREMEIALRERNRELESFNEVTVGRENRMVELKDRIKELEEQLEKLKKKD
jgi:PAS domain S-box-containing protein